MNALTRHSAALRRVLRVGTPVEFVETTATYDEATDSHTVVSLLTTTGHAVQLEGDMSVYSGMTLAETNPITLLFIPDNVSDLPKLGAQVVWQDEIKTVRAVHNFTPDGHGIGAKVVVA